MIEMITQIFRARSRGRVKREMCEVHKSRRNVRKRVRAHAENTHAALSSGITFRRRIEPVKGAAHRRHRFRVYVSGGRSQIYKTEENARTRKEEKNIEKERRRGGP